MMEYIKKNKNGLLFALLAIVLCIVLLNVFKKKDSFEYELDNDYLRDYEINEIVPVYVTDEEMAKKYLSEYVNLMLNRPDKAYELLSDNYKENKYTSLNEFKQYINNIFTTEFSNAIVVQYGYNYIDGNNCLVVEDKDGNRFKFIESSIMNYKVEIN